MEDLQVIEQMNGTIVRTRQAELLREAEQERLAAMARSGGRTGTGVRLLAALRRSLANDGRNAGRVAVPDMRVSRPAASHRS